MAHNINSMMYNSENGKPWHGLGTAVIGAQNWIQAMTAAGLDWTVDKQPLFDQSGNMVPVFGIFRSDNRTCLGAVGDVYQTIQNRFAFEFVDSLIESGSAHYDTAGALGKGERIWCLAEIKSDFEVVSGDKHKSFLLFETSHDGSKSATAKLTTIRVVCNNTLNAALRGSGESLSIRHTRSADEKMRVAKSLMTGAVQSVTTLKEKLVTLAERRLTRESMKSIFDRLFPVPKEGGNQTRRENQIADVLKLYDSNDKNAIPEIRGTAYNLLNAVTEYTDHFRTARVTDGRQHLTTAQARTESALFGSGSQFKEKALEYVLAGTQDAPTQAPKKYFEVNGADYPYPNPQSMPPTPPTSIPPVPDRPNLSNWIVAESDKYLGINLTSDQKADNSDYDAGFAKGKMQRRISMPRNAYGMAGQFRQGYLDGWNSGA